MANGPALTLVNTGTARSTPTKDTRAAEASGDEFERALHLFESETAAFAKSVINDPAARSEYNAKAKAAAAELIELVKNRKITPHEAACMANDFRNQTMALSRLKLSDLGRAYSEARKVEGPPLKALEEKYALKLHEKDFASLTQAERETVWLEIVHASGRPNGVVNLRARVFGVAGRGFLILSLALAVYNVTTARDKGRQVAKESTSLAAGAAGGAVGGIAVLALASNPAGWVVGAVMFASAALAGVGSSELFDYFWPER